VTGEPVEVAVSAAAATGHLSISSVGTYLVKSGRKVIRSDRRMGKVVITDMKMRR
jgi:hypothetical protein